MQFQDLNLSNPLLRAVREAGYETPTPIQAQAIPHILSGSDITGTAQTGTGKTAAFALPIIQRLTNDAPNGKFRPIRALVLSPTRELASQIGDSFRTYGKHTSLKHTVIFGGVSQHGQVKALKRGVDVVVATPGRLLDLMNQGFVRLDRVEMFVLDEADRMLDMGFLPDMRRVINKLPDARQTLLFSATMPREIQKLANQILKSPVHIEVTPQSTPVERIDQSVYFVNQRDKRALLIQLLDDQSVERVLIFMRTKHSANRLVQKLDRARINAEAIHGDKSQGARQRALANFKKGKTRVLVATDIASRGIDVDDVTHVINYDLPQEAESYVHRIGRTARAGASGVAYSFCDTGEHKQLRSIERLMDAKINVVENHEFAQEAPTNNGNGNNRRRSKSRNNKSRRNNRSRNNKSRGSNRYDKAAS